MHLYFKPVKKGQKIIRDDGRIEKAPYADLSIPHYIGSKRPTIPNFTYGGWAVSMKFTDNSSVSVKTLTKEEGVNVILALCKFLEFRLKKRER